MPALPSNLKLVILDRDGVINYDSDAYIKSSDEWRPLPGSIDAISELKHAGVLVCIATNQSGLGRGYFKVSDFIACQEKLNGLLQPLGASVDAVFYCPHSPDDGCACRKPKPLMALEALARFQVNPENAVFVGDSLRDLQSAEAAGVTPILVKSGNGEKILSKPDFFKLVTKDIAIFDNLEKCVSFLLDR